MKVAVEKNKFELEKEREKLKSEYDNLSAESSQKTRFTTIQS